MDPMRNHLLLVGDYNADWDLLERIFLENGLTVRRAFSPQDVLDAIVEEPPRLVILQDFFSGASGLEICRGIRGIPRCATIPVYILTDDASKCSRRDITAAGADGFIIRPFAEAEVWQRIETRLRMVDTEARLKGALANIDNLTGFGEQLLEYFDPDSFEYQDSLDLVVKQVIGGSRPQEGKAERVVIALSDARNIWHWYCYEYAFGRLQRSEVSFDVEDIGSFLTGKERRSFFFNEGELEEPVASQLVKLFRSRSIPVWNMVVYLSSRLAVMAINYDQVVSEVEASVLKSLAMQSLFLSSLAERVRETEDAFFYTINALAKATELHDDDTGNHIIRVGQISAFLADHLGQSAQYVKHLAVHARVHDVGKAQLPRELLRKPGIPTPEEWSLIRRHPEFGAGIIGDHVRLKMARNIALTHHERWDGSGYPQGLKGDEIPLEGRIVCLADHYDALRNPRTYKRAFSHQEVCWIITKGDHRTNPGHFDPKLLKIFINQKSRIAEIYSQFGDDKLIRPGDLRY